MFHVAPAPAAKLSAMQNEMDGEVAFAAQKVQSNLSVNRLLNNDLAPVLSAANSVFHREMRVVSRLRVDGARRSMGASAPSRRRRGYWGWGKFHHQVLRDAGMIPIPRGCKRREEKTSCPRRHAFSRCAYWSAWPQRHFTAKAVPTEPSSERSKITPEQWWRRHVWTSPTLQLTLPSIRRRPHLVTSPFPIWRREPTL